MKKFSLSRPVFREGAEIVEISINESMLTKELIRATSMESLILLREKKLKMVIDKDFTFVSYLAAKVSEMPYEFITSLGMRDFKRLCLLIAGYVAAAESE